LAYSPLGSFAVAGRDHQWCAGTAAIGRGVGWSGSADGRLSTASTSDLVVAA